MLLNLSLSVVVKQAEGSDHSPQVASDLQGSHTMVGNKSNRTKEKLGTAAPLSSLNPKPSQLDSHCMSVKGQVV